MRFLLIFLALLVTVLAGSAQTVYVGAGCATNMSNGRISPCITIGADYDLDQCINVGLQAEACHNAYDYSTYITGTNVTYQMGVYLDRFVSMGDHRLNIFGGFGWGHVFGSMTTDHNFFTYRAGARYSIPLSQRLSFYVEPTANWRTYCEHIGPDPRRGWWQLNTGVRLTLGKSNAKP